MKKIAILILVCSTSFLTHAGLADRLDAMERKREREENRTIEANRNWSASMRDAERRESQGKINTEYKEKMILLQKSQVLLSACNLKQLNTGHLGDDCEKLMSFYLGKVKEIVQDQEES